MVRSRGWDAVRSNEIAKAAAMTEHAEKIDQLAAALVAFQSDMPAVPKNSENPFYHSKYADMADVVEVAKPVLAKHGLAVAQFLSHNEDRNTLVTYLLHSSGQYLSGEMLLMLPKNDPQGQGSAATYARRYAYSAALGIVTDSDDDGNAAASAHQRDYEFPAVPVPKPFVLAEFHKACADADVDPLDVLAHAEIAKPYVELDIEDRPALLRSLKALASPKDSPNPSGEGGLEPGRGSAPASGSAVSDRGNAEQGTGEGGDGTPSPSSPEPDAEKLPV